MPEYATARAADASLPDECCIAENCILGPPKANLNGIPGEKVALNRAGRRRLARERQK
jgi:hypothetical protein